MFGFEFVDLGGFANLARNFGVWVGIRQNFTGIWYYGGFFLSGWVFWDLVGFSALPLISAFVGLGFVCLEFCFGFWVICGESGLEALVFGLYGLGFVGFGILGIFLFWLVFQGL